MHRLEGYGRGYQIIAVWSSEVTEEFRDHTPQAAQSLQFCAQVEECTTLVETAHALQQACEGLDLAALFVGSESGFTLADALSEILGLRTNSTAFRGRLRTFQKEVALSWWH